MLLHRKLHKTRLKPQNVTRTLKRELFPIIYLHEALQLNENRTHYRYWIITAMIVGQESCPTLLTDGLVVAVTNGCVLL